MKQIALSLFVIAASGAYVWDQAGKDPADDMLGPTLPADAAETPAALPARPGAAAIAPTTRKQPEQFRTRFPIGKETTAVISARPQAPAFRFFSTHRTWEDWFGMLLGVLIVVSPWFPFQTHDIVDNERSIMILNTFVIGMLVFGLAQLEYVALQRWEEVGAIVLGCWLIASPFLFGYSGDTMLQIWHAVLGGLVVLLGALQLWQDWNLSDQDLANHAQ